MKKWIWKFEKKMVGVTGLEPATSTTPRLQTPAIYPIQRGRKTKV